MHRRGTHEINLRVRDRERRQILSVAAERHRYHQGRTAPENLGRWLASAVWRWQRTSSRPRPWGSRKPGPRYAGSTGC